mgnify:CR=1 FL=1
MIEQTNTNSEPTHQMIDMTHSEQIYWQNLVTEYETHVIQISQQHFSAAKVGVNQCMRCGLCCYQYPCIPRPEEIEPIAQYLGLSVLELINQYMVIDTAECKVYFLRWAKHGEEDLAGKMIPPARTFDRGYCILYDKESRGCRIHPVRPQEARVIKCWKKNSGKDKSLWGITGWSEQAILQFLPDFSPHVWEDNKYLPPKSSMSPRKY